MISECLPARKLRCTKNVQKNIRNICFCMILSLDIMYVNTILHYFKYVLPNMRYFFCQILSMDYPLLFYHITVSLYLCKRGLRFCLRAGRFSFVYRLFNVNLPCRYPDISSGIFNIAHYNRSGSNNYILSNLFPLYDLTSRSYFRHRINHNIP